MNSISLSEIFMVSRVGINMITGMFSSCAFLMRVFNSLLNFICSSVSFTNLFSFFLSRVLYISPSRLMFVFMGIWGFM